MFTDLYFFSVLANYFHQPGEQVGHGPGGNGLPQGPEDLEGATGVVAGRAAQGRLQRHVTELLLQVQICHGEEERKQLKQTNQAMVTSLDGRRDSPDLDSLNTEMTYRKKLVSCKVLLETWFFGEMSSWHHSGPYALINKKKKCPRLFSNLLLYCTLSF